MQTIRKTFKCIHSAAFAAIVVSVISFTAQAQAQYKAAGTDGITASPRVRQQLDEARSRNPKAQPAAKMDCENCKDVWVQHDNVEPKGAGSRALTGNTSSRAVKHLCKSCEVDWKTVGTGKSREMVAAHTCGESVPSGRNCCAE